MASSSGPRQTAVLLLEDARKNYVTESEDFNEWSDAGAISSSGQSDPYGGTAAFLMIDDTSTAASVSASPALALDSSGPFTVSWFTKQGTTQAPSGASISIRDETAGTNRGLVKYTWSSGVPSLTFEWSATSVAPPERWRDGWWRLQFASPATVSTSNSNKVYANPAIALTTEVGDVYLFGVQVE